MRHSTHFCDSIGLLRLLNTEILCKTQKGELLRSSPESFTAKAAFCVLQSLRENSLHPYVLHKGILTKKNKLQHNRDTHRPMEFSTENHTTQWSLIARESSHVVRIITLVKIKKRVSNFFPKQNIVTSNVWDH